MLTTARCCAVVSRHHSVKIAMLQAVTGFGRNKHDKGSCCKEVAQTEGKTVEPWPKSEPPPPAWRASCPADPQPPNYDPYKIKVPDVVVPPLPPSNAKEVPNEDAEPFRDFQVGRTCRSVQDLFHNSPIVHPDYWTPKPERQLENLKETLPKLGYHGKSKYMYAFHEPWKPLDRITLMEKAEKEEVAVPKDVELKSQGIDVEGSDFR